MVWSPPRTLLLGLLVSFGCGASPDPPPRTIFLIVLDTASALYMGTYGEAAPTTPQIDLLARDSIVFDQAYSQSATTTASTASLFTGVRVTTHRVFRPKPYAAELRPIAELLRDAGFATRSVVGNYYAGALVFGFDRGFEQHLKAWEPLDDDDSRASFGRTDLLITRPSEITELVERQLDEPREGDAFFYVHYLRPHEPYDAPHPYREKFPPPSPECRETAPGWTLAHRKQRLNDNVSGTTPPCTVEHSEALYRATMRWVDDGVGELIRSLKERGLYEESLILLTADHGEAFFGHQIYGHNSTLYDDMTRIPLMLKLPASEGTAPRRIANPVETIDILPTLMDFAGVDIPEQAEGDSLLPLARGEVGQLAGEEVILSTLDRRTHAIRVGDLKYIYRHEGEAELYDLSEDRSEQENLVARHPERADELLLRLRAAIPLEGEEGSPLPEAPMEGRVRKLLERLGYVEPEGS